MINRIIRFSVNNKMLTGLFLAVFIAYGIYSAINLSIDALPDVTNNQVLVNTSAPNLATQEVEQFITTPLELQFKNIPDMVELRSISRSGLSVITVVFKDNVPLNIARQLVTERIKNAEEQIPASYGRPELTPPTTGLGEIYQYTLALKPGYEKKYTAMDLRSTQDWIVRKQLLGVPGVVDVSSFGGYLKQYEVAINPEKLLSMNISLLEVYDALSRNNENTGGSYIDKGPNIYFIRGEGLITSLKDIENIVVKTQGGMPVYIKDLGVAKFGYAPRYGAMTRNGKGETVGAVVLMMKGANSVQVIKAVKERMAKIEKSLPEGIYLDVFVDRTKLINRTISTVGENLLIGALIVIFVLVLLLGNIRAGLIVASIIPLSLLFAIILMNLFGVSANLMSMGALDFGLIVDGAVIIVESMMFLLMTRFKGAMLTKEQMNDEVIKSSSQIMKSAVFGQFVILIVYVPIFALIGVEGKMFHPMAQTVSFAIIGALLLSLTYVPLMSSLFLSKKVATKETYSERFSQRLQRHYTPFLEKVLKHRLIVIGSAVVLFIGAVIVFSRLGGEFIPELDEGDFAVNYTIRQGSNLPQTIAVGTQLENILLKEFPEVKEVVSKIGSSEIPTDPMPVESADLIIVMKEQKYWTTAHSREEMAELMNQKLSVIPGINLSFEQPIQMRFNELIAGVKSDIAIKIYGDDLDMLFQKGNEVKKLVSDVKGAVDIKVEQIVGMPQLVVKYNRDRIAQYGLNIADVNKVLNTALAGGHAGIVYEGERRFDLVVRLADYRDADIDKVKNIFVPLANGSQIPISQLADVTFKTAPAQISRNNGERRIVIEVNTRNRDIQSVATDIEASLSKNLKLPSGYFVEYGGTFENLREAKARLTVAVPVALLLIFVLLYLSFRNFKEALIIFSAIPLAAIGGILALWLRGMNFSISAGIGFIALFGVAVLNGIVLISYFNRLEEEGEDDTMQRVLKGTAARLRPVLATAAVASLGFLPMAVSTSAGSEVQKPLATVVIGGLISSTLLTLVVLPVLYSFLTTKRKKGLAVSVMLISALLLSGNVSAQTTLSLDSCISVALRNHPSIAAAGFGVEQQQQLKKTSFAFDRINLNYQGGQINGQPVDYNISATTGIPFPTTIVAQTKLQNQKVELAKQQLNVTRAELIRNVTIAYYQLLFGKQRFQMLSNLETSYKDFSTYANKKYTLGESNQLEKLSAEAQLKQIQLEQQQAQNDIYSYQAELQQWIGYQSNFNIADDTLSALPQPTIADTSALTKYPLLVLREKQTTVSQAEYKLERSKWAPSIQFGGFVQSLDKIAPFGGWNTGLSLPFIKTGQQGRTQAALLQSKIAAKDYEVFRLQLTNAYLQALQQYNKYFQAVNYYKTEGLPLANAITNAASKSYKAGDIGYLEYILSIKQAYAIKSDYVQALYSYNQSVVNLNYYLNK